MEDLFLPDPQSIRRALRKSLATASRLDMAVAFVGKDWKDILGSFHKPVRLITWLTSTNTNPHAVGYMLNHRSSGRRQFTVRHRDLMHTKVYLLRGESPAAIVGSSNLTMSALAEDDTTGQFEAAMLVRNPATIAGIAKWFEHLWKTESNRIEPGDLAAAKRAWDAYRKMRRRIRKAKPGRPSDDLPPGWIPSQRLRRIADEIRHMRRDSHGDIRLRRKFFSGIKPAAMTRADLLQVIDFVAEWTGHRGVYLPALKESLARIRSVFEFAFDESVEIVHRLEHLDSGGRWKLRGFGLNAWTLIFSWRNPEYLPFNGPSLAFLRAFRLGKRVGSSVTPASYGKWRGLARGLQQRFNLHDLHSIDLMVDKYYGHI